MQSAPSTLIAIHADIITIDSHYLKNIGILFQSRSSNGSTRPWNFDVGQAAGAINTLLLPLIKISDNNILDLQLSALENQGHANILASPEIITANQQTATIETGDEVPYQQATSSGATSVTFKKAVLSLAVTPTLLKPHVLQLHLTINQDKVGSLSVNGVPSIRTQKMSTTVHVTEGQQIALGGIFENSSTQQREGLPGLSRWPWLQTLFSRRQRSHERKYLLVLISTKILKA